MSKYTPGPWKYNLNLVGPTKGLIVEEDGSTVVEIRTNVMDSRFAHNARLIAAAPELLDAAKLIRSRHIAKAREANFADCGCEDCCPFKAAIAKAEGQ